jgi:hypothetical protein
MFVYFFILSLLLSSCGIKLSDCAGPLLNTQKLLEVQQDRFFSGPQAYLVLPNPIDSPRLSLFSFTASTFRGAQQGVGLPNLQSQTALENTFLKIRRNGFFDSADKLVNQQMLSSASNDIRDPQYSQVMAYHSITAISDYAQSLGFSINKSRPLYVIVRASEDPSNPNSTVNSSEVNAYYVHNKFQPNQPRLIQLKGDSDFPLGADRDTYWHEFGHLFNESVSADRGFDEATDLGDYFVQSRAIHECLADYLDQSASNKDYIGKWGAKNFSDIPAGFPIRSAASLNDGKSNYSSVANYDARKGIPDNYELAEWCSRVLWDIRSQFKKEDQETGALFSDRVVFAAAGLLPKNASLADFRSALLSSDSQLHCGIHQQSIKKAFESRGFSTNIPKTSQPLLLSLSPVGFKDVTSPPQKVSPNGDADEIVFNYQITNPNGATARNVRIQIESSDPAVLPLVSLQGYGDLPGGQTIRLVGNGYQDYDTSISLSLDRKYANGRQKVRFLVKILVENGPATSQWVELSL